MNLNAIHNRDMTPIYLLKLHCFILGDDSVVSLPLQMALYFNVVFFPVWIIVMLFMLPVKVIFSIIYYIKKSFKEGKKTSNKCVYFTNKISVDKI